jgi:hypothetical protein
VDEHVSCSLSGKRFAPRVQLADDLVTGVREPPGPATSGTSRCSFELIKVAAPYLTHALPHPRRMLLMSVRRVPSDSSKPLIGYQVRWRDAGGSQRKRLFKGQQKRAAETFHAETIAALSRGQYIDVTDKTTVTEYARQWVSIQPYRPSSRERRESQIRTHLEPSRLGQMRLVKVRHSDVQAFATDLDRRRAAERVRGSCASWPSSSHRLRATS